MAEIFRIDPETLLDWESGRTPISESEWIDEAISALEQAHRCASPVCMMVDLDGEL